MAEFHKGNRAEGLRLQEEFASEFRKEYADKDHCPCQKACRYHGNCKECVAIHRAHQEHVPNCMRPMINKKLKILSKLTEHTLANEIEAPKEVLRKEFLEAYVCVAVSIFNTNNHVVNDSYTWTIAQELLVGWFCIILLCYVSFAIRLVQCLRRKKFLMGRLKFKRYLFSQKSRIS